VRALETKRDAGTVEAAGKAPTVGEWLHHWLDDIAARKVRARTLESYRSTVRSHLGPGLGHHRLDRLQPEHLARLYGVLARDSARRRSCAPTGCCPGPSGWPRSAARSHATSPRWSEALGLQWTDVDTANGTSTVRGGRHRVGGQGLISEEPKADRSRRTVALPKQLVETLVAHRAVQREERIAAGPLWQDDDLVAAQPDGRPIERKSDWHSW
jgi:integrase